MSSRSPIFAKTDSIFAENSFLIYIINNIAIENVIKPNDSSFCAVAYANAYFAAPLHIHPEYELILIEQGTGLTFVGDTVHKMSCGDFMLLGKNLPHLWLSADEYYEKDTKLISSSVYSQFSANIFPTECEKIPEFTPIYNLLMKSQRGLIFTGSMQQEIQNEFRQLPHHKHFKKLIELYKILYELSQCEYRYLTSEHYKNNELATENDAIIKKAYEYINTHYQENIALTDIAQYVGMNPSALCRYYKKHTGKTLFEYLSGMRISYAAKLLMNKHLNISQIAYDCGYNNLSNFNKQFKAIIGKTPTEYCKLIRKD